MEAELDEENDEYGWKEIALEGADNILEDLHADFDTLTTEEEMREWARIREEEGGDTVWMAALKR